MIRWVQKYRQMKRIKALESWKNSFAARCKDGYRQLFQGSPTTSSINFYISLCISEYDRKHIDEMCQLSGEDATANWLADQLGIPVEKILKT